MKMGDADFEAPSHKWEKTSGHAWESVVEDADGNLITEQCNPESIANAIRKRRHVLAQRDYAQSSRRIVRDMIRYLYLVIDLSRSMREKDSSLSPSKTRMEVVLANCMAFVDQFYDQNPLSHLGMILCRDGEAEMFTQLTGSPRMHKAAITALAHSEAGTGPTSGGEFSLQNGLEVAGRSLAHMPMYGSREVFFITAALSTSDPGDILLETLPRLVHAHVRFSCVALSAEMYVCRRIAEATDGVMAVCLDQHHLRDLILGQCVPPPTTAQNQPLDVPRACQFVQMGFPTRETSDIPSLIHATHNKKLYALTGYLCPRCKAKASDLPTDCAVCGLKLVLAPHLARSFHHLFPVSPFVELHKLSVTTTASSTFNPPAVISSSDFISSATASSHNTISIDETLLLSSDDCGAVCYGCLKHLVPPPPHPKTSSSSKSSLNADSTDTYLRFQCPDCSNVFCADCDAYLHDTLHNCPGCLCRTTKT